jgi:peroxiredoxin
MERISWTGVTAILLAMIVVTGTLQGQERRLYLPIGSDAPAVEGIGVDGARYSLHAMAAESPVFLIFWKDPCPHNRRAMPFLNALTKAYDGKVQFLSVVRSSEEGTRKFAEDFDPAHPLLADPEGKWLQAYEMSRSIVPVKVGADGKILDIFDGYGRDELQRLSQTIAGILGVPVADVDLARAPERHPTYG